MIRGQRVAVVIPAFNEQRLLPVTLGTIPGYVDAVVVVDDASTDDTAAVAASCACPVPVIVQRHESNQGVGAAIVTGYRWCRDNGIDVSVVMGADNQMDPHDMPGLLLPIIQGEADYVAGDRMSWPGGWKMFPRVRLVGVVALAWLTRWATGLSQIRDAQCGYTAINHHALCRLDLDGLYPRYGFPNDLLARVAEARLRVTTRPVRPVYADEQSKLQISRVVVPLLRLTVKNRLARQTAQESGSGVGVVSSIIPEDEVPEGSTGGC